MKIDVRTVGPFQENCYLVVDEATDHAVLVDPGDEGARLVRMVRDSGATLEAIWLTHAHIDHIGGVAEVRRHYDVPVHLHPLDLPYYTTLSARAADMYGVDFEQPEGPHAELADGQVLSCGTLRFTVMHVPGHAPGLVSFNGHGVALSGDLLFAGSIGRTDLPLSNPFDMDASLARFGALPPETVVYPGHGGVTTLAEEQRSNPFLAGRARTVKR
ncbi:MAG: MBL fold metallo-hydrolase [Gemmatimonadaceae bacterium]|nr:MBL fold metallo-hydrolase [Gemmatimonadaceae bacterium]NUS47877.1 MBL fold metallo-hydrolase [Gemmatimonadaceae bacterium]